VGTPEELKRRSGANYKISLNTSLDLNHKNELRSAGLSAGAGHSNTAGAHTEGVYARLESALRSALGPAARSLRLLTATGGAMCWELSRGDAPLSQVFAAVQRLEGQHELCIEDWAVCNSTLEEVFLRVASESELELASRKPHQDLEKRAGAGLDAGLVASAGGPRDAGASRVAAGPSSKPGSKPSSTSNLSNLNAEVKVAEPASPTALPGRALLSGGRLVVGQVGIEMPELARLAPNHSAQEHQLQVL